MWEPNIEVTFDPVHKKYLRACYNYGERKSGDRGTHTTALIVYDGSVVFRFANDFPPGLNPTEEQRRNRDYKLQHIIHAEDVVIRKAEKNGFRLSQAVMYMPWVPCTPCANRIIESGLRNLIGHESMILKTPEDWWESTGNAIELLESKEVNFMMYRGNIGGCQNLFRGEIWHP